MSRASSSTPGSRRWISALPSAVPTINDWVNQSTNGKIDKIVDGPIASDVVMYLINAIYFNGSWTTRFDKSQTRPDQFTTVERHDRTDRDDAPHRHRARGGDGGCAGAGPAVRRRRVLDDDPRCRSPGSPSARSSRRSRRSRGRRRCRTPRRVRSSCRCPSSRCGGRRCSTIRCRR